MVIGVVMLSYVGWPQIIPFAEAGQRTAGRNVDDPGRSRHSPQRTRTSRLVGPTGSERCWPQGPYVHRVYHARWHIHSADAFPRLERIGPPLNDQRKPIKSSQIRRLECRLQRGVNDIRHPPAHVCHRGHA